VSDMFYETLVAEAILFSLYIIHAV